MKELKKLLFFISSQVLRQVLAKRLRNWTFYVFAYGALHSLVPSVKFKEMEAPLKPASLLKLIFLHVCFSRAKHLIFN